LSRRSISADRCALKLTESSPVTQVPLESPEPPKSSRVDRVSIAAVVVGVVSLFTFFFVVPSVIAIVLGISGLSRSARLHDKDNPSKGFAGRGLILGVVALLPGLLLWLLLASDPCFLCD
jgi:hypothetical protein